MTDREWEAWTLKHLAQQRQAQRFISSMRLLALGIALLIGLYIVSGLR
jgi:hypothetical protein